MFVPAYEAVGEDDGILDGLRRALPDAGRRRVRGVADQDDAAVAPAGERLQVVDIVTQNGALVGRLDDRRDRLVPAGEAPPNLRLPAPGSSGSPSGAFLVANQYVRPRPMSTSPKRSPTPHDSVRRPASTGTEETPRQAV